MIDVLRMELEQKLPYWLSPEGKGLREDAMAANHTGAAVAGFDPLLRRRKRKERLIQTKATNPRGRCGGASREWRRGRDGYELGCLEEEKIQDQAWKVVEGNL